MSVSKVVDVTRQTTTNIYPLQITTQGVKYRHFTTDQNPGPISLTLCGKLPNPEDYFDEQVDLTCDTCSNLSMTVRYGGGAIKPQGSKG